MQEEISKYYIVTECGNVISKRTCKIMKLQPNRNGYLSARLFLDNRKQKRLPVHKLVAIFHLPIRKNDQTLIRHLDGNMHNNYYRNLAWGTCKENMIDKVNHGRVPKKYNKAVA